MRKKTDYTNIEQRIRDKSYVDELTGCWIFDGADYGKEEYGKIRFLDKDWPVHRLSAHLFLNLDLNDSEQFACHQQFCPNRKCWNPDHLYIGNAESNINDALQMGTKKPITEIRKEFLESRITCKNDHTLVDNQCLICRKEYVKEYNKIYYNENKISYKLD